MNSAEFFGDPDLDRPNYPSTFFHPGTAVEITRYFRPHKERFVEVGNIEYSDRSRQLRRAHRRGYIAMQLSNPFPHMLLDSLSNNFMKTTGLPVLLDAAQVLPLEGDFNSHFTLYAQDAYATDALYFFTPDLMALLIDETGDLDVEINNDWLFIHSREPFDLDDELVVQRLLAIVDVVGAKAQRRSQNFDSYSASTPIPARHSARPGVAGLRRRTTPLYMAICGLAIAVVILLAILK